MFWMVAADMAGMWV